MRAGPDTTAAGADAEQLAVAVIGTGFVGPFHVDAVRRGGYGSVVALVGSDRTRTASRAAALGVPRAATVDEVMRDDEIDVVHICTPNRLHAGLAIAALDAGKHVVIEKPVALSVDEAQSVADVAHRSRRHAAVAYTYRGYPMVRRARALVAAGQLGDIRLLHGGYIQDWLSSERDYNWRLEPGQSGRSRAVADIGTHWLDTVEYISGLRVEAVAADLATFIATRRKPSEAFSAFAGSRSDGSADEVAIESEDAATILFRFHGGARGACVVSQVSPGRKNLFTMEIAGSERSMHWNQEDPEHLWLRDRSQASLLTRDVGDAVGGDGTGVPVLPAGHPEGWADAFRDLFRPFYAAILRGDPPDADAPAYPTVRDGLRGLQFVEAAVESSRTGRWTSLKRSV